MNIVNINKSSSTGFWKKNKIAICICALVIISIIFTCFAVVHCSNTNIDNNTNSKYQENKDKLPTLQYISIMQKLKNCNQDPSSYSEILNMQIETVDKLASVGGTTQFGNLSPNYFNLQELNFVADELVNTYGEPVSFIMYDLNSNSGVYYSIDMQTYLASSIKLPYVASILDEDPERYNENTEAIYNVLVESSNEDYDYLRLNYGTSRLSEWNSELKIENDISSYYYPSYINAIDIVKLWFKTFQVINTNKYSAQLLELSGNSLNSAIYKAVGSKYKISSKPGWFDCYGESDAGYTFDGITNDCGVIFANENPYILIVLTEIPDNSEAVSKLVEVIDRVHDSMVDNLKYFTTTESYPNRTSSEDM